MPQQPTMSQQQAVQMLDASQQEPLLEHLPSLMTPVDPDFTGNLETIEFDVSNATEVWCVDDSDEVASKIPIPLPAFVLQNLPDILQQSTVNQQHLYPVKTVMYPWMEALHGGSWVESSLEREAMQGSIHPEAIPVFRSTTIT